MQHIHKGRAGESGHYGRHRRTKGYGLGRLLVDSVEMRDYPVIQAEVLLFSLEFIVINLVVDLLYAAINPAIRYK